MGIPAEVAALGWRDGDGGWAGVWRHLRRDLLCAGCCDGEAAVGFPDWGLGYGQPDLVRNRWEAACCDCGGARALRFQPLGTMAASLVSIHHSAAHTHHQ